MNLSLTQAGNYTAFIPVLILVLNMFGITVTESELAQIITGAVAIGGLLVSIYGRYRQNDVNIFGVKEQLG